MDGQISIFDLPEFKPQYTPFDEMTIEEAAEILNQRCELSFKKSDFVFADGSEMYKCKKGKYKLSISFGRYCGGRFIGQRFLGIDIDGNFGGSYCGVGYGELDIECAIWHINKALTEGIN